MAESTTASSFAEELKAKHAADHAHQPTVEEVPDEDIVPHKAGGDAAASEDKPSWVETPSATSVGKQKEQPIPKAALDTQSHELFPELGGPKPKPVVVPAGVPRAVQTASRMVLPPTAPLEHPLRPPAPPPRSDMDRQR